MRCGAAGVVCAACDCFTPTLCACVRACVRRAQLLAGSAFEALQSEGRKHEMVFKQVVTQLAYALGVSPVVLTVVAVWPVVACA